ncbi:hypothetical protein RJT34_02908 [Clitoria ternatea]|uniref:Uncharacterized protein n=1 Tax=Clitoria ternatea TaxID=43366 RepID=A0AAN9KJ99_CLITE
MNSNGRVFVSRHIVFNEDCFPFHDGFLNTKKPADVLIEPTSFFYPFLPAGTSNGQEINADQEFYPNNFNSNSQQHASQEDNNVQSSSVSPTLVRDQTNKEEGSNTTLRIMAEESNNDVAATSSKYTE